MLKRGNPFTPSPAVVGKKTREYASPTVRTPLRNVTGGKEGLVEETRNPPRTPLNDDEGERRRNRTEIAKNRKQTKKTLMSPAVSTPRANPPSMLTPKGATPLTPSAIMADIAIKPVAAPKLTAEQRNKMFEEWMKIAADNNSWNVSLIDYFSELTFLRDGDSINFQKASCTLDGCVKIYATRVDSVADETGKLLNGLADGSKSKHSITRLIGIESKIDFLEETVDGDESKKQRSNKRPSRAVDTLERSLEALNLKNFDLEFAVDPLFKKMCAEFDESGTRGFLTCTLSLDEKGRLMFDSSEAASLAATQDTETADESMINISRLLETHGRHFSDLENKTVLPSLVDYSFGSVDLGKLDKKLSETVAKLTAMTVNKMDVESDDDVHEDYTAFDEALPLDDGMYDEPTLVDRPAFMDQPAFMEQSAFMDEPSPHYDNPHIQQTTEDTQGFSADTADSFLSYFDSKIQRNWAGPEHWKIQRPSLRRADVKPRVAKKEFVLDFDAAPIDISTLFVKANPVSITLSKSILDERGTKDNLLPDDLNFSSAELLRLFTKPSWTIGKRRVTLQTPEDRPDLIPREVDTAYWADPENTVNFQETTGFPSNAVDSRETAEFAPLDDGGYSDYDEPPMPDVTDTQIGNDLVDTFRPAVISDLQYARRAKKVNVQELKRVLWEEIEALPRNAAGRLSSVLFYLSFASCE
ncbi:Condensin complex subunit 2 [Paramicrosporidium saccamoebae]|uniref:Condensin complex subunit 2 n=1 Tax=Paramicrosporidium saccamoebae TaxID=1246581 RepID=A0A2H9TJT6_9FUNG|nr:Condensin complex subunit 2 [Paramicrosporidium saccamoebae]